MSLERKTKFLFHALLSRMRQLVTFGTGTGSMHAVASKVAISYSCPVSF
jgi:hypothetical protein